MTAEDAKDYMREHFDGRVWCIERQEWDNGRILFYGTIFHPEYNHSEDQESCRRASGKTYQEMINNIIAVDKKEWK